MSQMTREELKAGVTPGEVVLIHNSYRCPATDEWESDCRITIGKQTVCHFDEDCNYGEPSLYAEAHNVANSTGMWPQDLVDRVKELEDSMRNFCSRVDRGEVRSKRTYAEFQELLNKHKP